MYCDMNSDMNGFSAPTRRVTANLPVALLEEACESTGKGLTETLVLGLEMVRRANAATLAMRLKGKLKIEIDLEASRERARR